MKSIKTTPTQQELAQKDGFTELFQFVDGMIQSLADTEKIYPTSKVEKEPRPCLITQTVVYRITTPDGLKGTAILFFMPDDND